MRRVKLVLGALVVVVAALAAFSGPAMADGWNNCVWNTVWWNTCHWNNGFDPGVVQAPTATYVAGGNVNNAGPVNP
jgi:hypothetical protein